MAKYANIRMWERLAALAERYGDVAKLAAATETSYTTLKGAIDENRKGINTETAEKLVLKTGCSSKWLLTGEGKMFEKAEGDRSVIIHFRHGANGATPGEREGANGHLVAIPVLRDAAAAGPGRVIKEDDVDGVGIIHRAWCPHPESTDYVRVKGDSMAPTIPDGAMVTIDKSRTESSRLIGKVVAIWIADEDDVTIKRLMYDARKKRLKAVPDNITLDNLPFDLTERDRIVGEVQSVHAPVK